MPNSVDADEAAQAIGPDRRTYQQYLDERRLLVESERTAADAFDKALLALCGGAIALSVAFAEKLGSAGAFKPLLYVSWLILVISLGFNLRSFLLLQASLNTLLQINDDLYEKGSSTLQNPFRGKLSAYNNASFWLFVLGVSCRVK